MKSGLLSILFVLGMQAMCSAQLGETELDDVSEPSTSSMEEILGKDFFDFRRPSTLRAAPTRGQARSISPASSRASGSSWDYRFDAQYQSTINPNARWYMRNDPNRPGERYLPRYMTEQGGNYSGYALGCSACGCSMAHQHGSPSCVSCGSGYGGFQGTGYQLRSPYWQHLDYLRGKYGSTPARPRRRTSHLDISQRMIAGAKSVTTKTVWVSRDAETKLVSVLFVEPPAAQGHKFFKGKAMLTPAMKLAGIMWEKEPDWSADIKLADSGATGKP